MGNMRIILVCLILVSILSLGYSKVDNYGGWNNAPNTQYHIQTDEGDERYFKYQTISGQYRKEKRLQDGTVVGTYGWVDPTGNLRLQDYVADNAGYRVLKSRMLFVGHNTDVGSAVAAAKHVPATSGTLVTPSPFPARATVYRQPDLYSNNLDSYKSYLPPTKDYLPPQSIKVYPPSINYLPPSQEYLPSTTPASTVRLFTPTVYSSTPAPFYYNYPSSTPVVDILPNAYQKFFVSSTLAPPRSTPAIGVYNNNPPSSTPSPISVGTPSSVGVRYSTATPVYGSSTQTPPVSSTPIYVSSTPAPYVSSTPRIRFAESSTQSPIKAIAYTASPPEVRQILPPIAGKFTNSVNNNFITETRKNQLYFEHERNRYRKRYVNSGSAEQEYDGISTVQNGFRYFLPRQYHEEQSSSDGQDRTGSFGYIDPFGIRRVIYYNTSPGRGFVHRKNNRYVGFNATPYDPRP